MRLQKIILIMIVFIVAIWLALSGGYSVFAAGLGIETLQKAIDEKGCKWTAGETSVSNLSDEEFRKMLGGVRVEVEPTEGTKVAAYPVGTVPTSFDWRSNGGNWITAIKDQGNCGACYAFATLGALEAIIRIASGNASHSIDLSEQYIVSCGPSGNKDGYDYGGCLGNYLDYTCDFLVNTGAPDESCFTYDSTQQSGTEPACANACADAASRVTKITSYSWVNTADPNAIPTPDTLKNVVYIKPVPVWMMVYEDFQYYTGGVYEYVSGDQQGGHFVVIIGWDDSQQCWIGKNSWGTSWGESGYFRIKWGECYVGVNAVDMSYSGTTGSSTTTTPSSTTTTASGVCPPDYPMDCLGDGTMCCPTSAPICCYGTIYYAYFCCYTDYPVCGTGADEGYCFEKKCGATGLLEDDEVKLDILRELRDTKMEGTKQGASLIDIYYEHTEEISDILLDDDGLKAITANVVAEIVEKAASLNNEEEVSIDRELVESILEIADAINADASPGLKRDIKKVKREIRRGTIFRQLGITVE